MLKIREICRYQTDAKMDCRTFAVFLFFLVSSCSASYNFSQFHDIFNLTVLRRNLMRVYDNLEANMYRRYHFLTTNWTMDPLCAAEFEKCNDTLSCCDEDLLCYKTVNNSFSRCTNISRDKTGDSMEEDISRKMNRLNDLTYDINYRDWANSFEFESQSAMQREDQRANEEEIWNLKHKNEVIAENKWLSLLKTLVEKSKRKWNEIQKMKKLKEVKNIIKEKMSSRKHKDSLPSDELEKPDLEEEDFLPTLEPREIEKPHKKQKKHNKKPTKVEDSKESRKKTYPGIDQLLRDADDMVKEHKAKGKEKVSSEERTASEKQRSNEIAQIEDTEDKLEEELRRLKALQNEEKQKSVTEGIDDMKKDEIKELIKKQVALILDQERKLSGLMKLNELKRMQENMKEQEIPTNVQP